MSFPVLETTRLLLRPFTLGDASVVQHLAGAPEVASTTQHIPHPYEDGVAEQWISTHRTNWEARRFLTLAITHETEGVVGAITLELNDVHKRGELGYWVGFPFWNCGYATEASTALVEFGFQSLGLNRIQARHMTRNPASGRVMLKVGMQFEGIHRQQIFCRGRFEDLAMYAILRSDRSSRSGNVTAGLRADLSQTSGS